MAIWLIARDADLKIIKHAVAAVLNSERVERNSQQVVEWIVNVVEAADIGSIIIWIVRRCDLICYFPKVLFAATLK